MGNAILLKIYDLKYVILRVTYKLETLPNFCLRSGFLFRVTKDLKGSKEREETLAFEVTR